MELRGSHLEEENEVKDEFKKCYIPSLYVLARFNQQLPLQGFSVWINTDTECNQEL